MVKEHYGKWIPEDTKPMAKLISKMMGADKNYSDNQDENLTQTFKPLPDI